MLHVCNVQLGSSTSLSGHIISSVTSGDFSSYNYCRPDLTSSQSDSGLFSLSEAFHVFCLRVCLLVLMKLGVTTMGRHEF